MFLLDSVCEVEKSIRRVTPGFISVDSFNQNIISQYSANSESMIVVFSFYYTAHNIITVAFFYILLNKYEVVVTPIIK